MTDKVLLEMEFVRAFVDLKLAEAKGAGVNQAFLMHELVARAVEHARCGTVDIDYCRGVALGILCEFMNQTKAMLAQSAADTSAPPAANVVHIGPVEPTEH